jgi:L-ascorbate metabolism protein UlaG (beta-lactamase superfamily)
MKLTWWGTAGFHVNTGQQTFLVDPYLSRNAGARPTQPMVPTDIKEADHIFLSQERWRKDARILKSE